MSNRPSLIIGHRGQDGCLLREQFGECGEPWVGIDVDCTDASTGDRPPVTDVTDAGAVDALIERVQPGRLYYLAACHESSERAERTDIQCLHRTSWAVHVGGWLGCLEAARRRGLPTRLLYASSSLVIGDRGEHEPLQDEFTPWKPIGVYGLTKALAVRAGAEYRQRHGVHVCATHLYNHESPYRPPRFLSRKVTDAAARIAAGSDETLTLGNLDAVTDWGYAPDYVRAMRLILDANEPGEFVIASGIGHTVRQFVEIAFDEVGLDWSKHVRSDESILSRANAGRIGNARKLREATGWAPGVDFEQMVRCLTRWSVARLNGTG